MKTTLKVIKVVGFMLVAAVCGYVGLWMLAKSASIPPPSEGGSTSGMMFGMMLGAAIAFAPWWMLLKRLDR
ncbi:MAG TPA: hypothetical protein PL051_02130 [Candidatus Saccharibacteria bacterium]|nr:hypothetical protein [Candidatus Saccharibacteria bacterium]